MRRIILCLACVSACGILTNGCDSEGQNALRLSCEATLGDKAVCKKISNDLQLYCFKSEKVSSENKENCLSVVNDFDLSCVLSGGLVEEKLCKCDGITCDDGGVCISNKNVLKCEIERSCDDGQTKCENSVSSDGKSIGQIYTCVKGEWRPPTACNDVSCQYKESDASKRKSDDLGVCGECVDSTISACVDSLDTGIGLIPTCRNGSRVMEACANNTSCKSDEESESVCGNCHNGDTQCIGDTSYQICEKGKWSETKVCPGNAQCVSDHCDDAGLTSCTGTTTLCRDGKIQECINEKYTVAVACQNSNGCKDSQTCGECRSGESRCENKDNPAEGSYIYSCGNDYMPVEPPEDSVYSCQSDTDDGECTNGFYKLIPDAVGVKKTVVQTCSNGKWPVVTSESSWPNDPVNDALFSHVAACSGKILSLYSNYNNVFTVESQNTDCKDFRSGEAYPITAEDNIYYIHGLYSSTYTLSAFLEEFYGADKTKPWFFSNNRYLWFGCNSVTCAKASVCLDILTQDSGFTSNLQPSAYMMEIDASNPDSPTVKLARSDIACNSNRTNITGHCTKYAIDMTHRYDWEDAIQSQSMSFDICKLGYQRSVDCKSNGGKYQCTLKPQKQIEDGAGFSDSISSHLCIDFYDKNHRHSAYRFANTTANLQDTFDWVETLPEDLSSKYIIRCKSNLCNENWSDCLCLDEEGHPCTCNDAQDGCAE